MRPDAVRKVVKLFPRSKTPNYKHRSGKFYALGEPVRRTDQKLSFHWSQDLELLLYSNLKRYTSYQYLILEAEEF